MLSGFLKYTFFLNQYCGMAVCVGISHCLSFLMSLFVVLYSFLLKFYALYLNKPFLGLSNTAQLRLRSVCVCIDYYVFRTQPDFLPLQTNKILYVKILGSYAFYLIAARL